MSKVLSLADAIHEYITPHCSVFIGAAHEALIPFAAVYEIIRQGTQHLTFCAPISDIASDLLVGAGLVDCIHAAWSGNVSGGLGHNLRRAAEHGVPHAVEMVDYSNYAMALALQAAAMGVPFLPTRSLNGSDLIRSRAGFEPFMWHGQPLVAVPALQPDVVILGVQKADADGNATIDGPVGMTHESLMAARHVVVLCEELVAKGHLGQESWHLTVPGFLVDAVVAVPYAFHPSPCLGYYGRDTAFFQQYHRESRDPQEFRQWLQDWVYVDGHADYLRRLGKDRLTHVKSEEGVMSWP